jgi:DNA mismatch repair protein MutS
MRYCFSVLVTFTRHFRRDAVTTAGVLGITLTKRSNGKATEVLISWQASRIIRSTPDLPKLVRAGYKVAVCDQLEDPKLAKGIVKRGVTEDWRARCRDW